MEISLFLFLLDRSSFPDISYHQDTDQTPPGSAVTVGHQHQIPTILTPSYATIAPLDTSEHIVYDDSFEYTGEISLRDQNRKSMHSSLGVGGLCVFGQQKHRNKSVLQSQSVNLMTNEAYGCASGTVSSDEFGETEDI